MEVIYIVYLVLALLIGVIDLYCIIINMKCIDNKFTFTILNLLFSVLLICLGCLMAIVNCQVSWSFTFIGLSAICVWQSFTMYATSTNKVILWNAAQKTMIIMAYIVPVVIYLISLLVMRNTDFHKNSQICAIKFNSKELLLTKILQFFFFFAFQLIFLIFGIIDSLKSTSFLERQKSRFGFLEQSYREALTLPIITSVLIISYFISFNIQYWLKVEQILMINNICSIAMEINLMILVFQYGFNSTILKVNAVRKVYQFRSNLELRYQNKYCFISHFRLLQLFIISLLKQFYNQNVKSYILYCRRIWIYIFPWYLQ